MTAGGTYSVQGLETATALDLVEDDALLISGQHRLYCVQTLSTWHSNKLLAIKLKLYGKLVC
ncbi:hypothetical protein DP117_16520 [Brasilonema sp. UFV-L1]|nr:hypothetical protein [Brasilonema sp. UFV-L1]